MEGKTGEQSCNKQSSLCNVLRFVALLTPPDLWRPPSLVTLAQLAYLPIWYYRESCDEGDSMKLGNGLSGSMRPSHVEPNEHWPGF